MYVCIFCLNFSQKPVDIFPNHCLNDGGVVYTVTVAPSKLKLLSIKENSLF